MTAVAIAVNPDADRAAWLEARRRGIGGSDAAAACGLDPYKTPLQLYLEKRGELAEPDLSQNLSVRFGNRLEQAVADEYEQQTGRRLQRVNNMLQSKERPFMLANLDRRVVGERRIVEIKTAGYWAAKKDEDWGPPGTDLVPIRYMLQVQHYLAVTSMPVCDLAVLVAGQEFRLYVIPRDEELISLLVERETAFWKRVTLGDPPPITTVDDGALRYPSAKDRPVYASTEIAALVGEMQDLQRQAKVLKEQFDARKTSVMEFMGEGDRLVLDGEPLATWKNGAKTSLDTTRLKAEKPDIYEAYVRRGTSRSFRIAGESE
jgi:putative phage-type endonuclease